MPRLSKRVVEGLEPRKSDYIVFDETLPGFGVRVYPTGGRIYLVQYRNGGRNRRYRIGRHGHLTVDEARTEAMKILAAVAAGDDPSEERRVYRIAPTVADLCDRFYNEYVVQRCKPSTQGEYKRSIDLFIKPEFGSFKVGDLKRPDVARLHHKLREKPYQANRTLGVISKMFNLAEVWGLRPDGSNPTRHVQKYRELKKERFLSPEEIGKLGRVLDACEVEETESPFIVAAFRLLILTGCRLSEIQKLKWSYWQAPYLVLPDSKVGPRKIPLAPQAQAILQAIPKILGNPWIIAGQKDGQHATDMQRPWRRIRQKAGLTDVRIHDLRHTYASNAVKGGLSLPMVAKLLGHTQIQTTMRYAHLADDPVREAGEQVAAGLAAALSAPPDPTPPLNPSNVVVFPGNKTQEAC